MIKNNFIGKMCVSALATLLFSACSKNDQPFRADTWLSVSEKNELIDSVIRYTGHLHPKADDESKFLAVFDEYYATLASQHTLDLFYRDSDTGKTFL